MNALPKSLEQWNCVWIQYCTVFLSNYFEKNNKKGKEEKVIQALPED